MPYGRLVQRGEQEGRRQRAVRCLPLPQALEGVRRELRTLLRRVEHQWGGTAPESRTAVESATLAHTGGSTTCCYRGLRGEVAPLVCVEQPDPEASRPGLVICGTPS